MFKHKEKDYIRRSNKRYTAPRCKFTATHGNIQSIVKPYINYATHFDNHALKKHVDIHNRPCNLCGLKSLLNFDNKCFYCNPENFEVNTKEMNVREYFNTHGVI
jgi:hypothetical protein